MKVKTEKINIFRKGLIPYKAKISYTYFKEKLFICLDTPHKFKRSFLDGFSELFFLNNSPYKEMLFIEDKFKTEPSDIFRSYKEFKGNFKARKPLPTDIGLKISERMKKMYKIKKQKRERAKRDLNKMIDWL